MKLNELFCDGANRQAQAVLAMVQYQSEQFEIQHVEVDRWENGREQGYIARNGNRFVVWYEHRNSDSIVSLSWVQQCSEMPNIDTIPAAVFYDKWSYHYIVNHGEILPMADWLCGELQRGNM